MTRAFVFRGWRVAFLACLTGLAATFLVHGPTVACQERAVRPKFEYRVLYEYQLLELAPKDTPSVEGALNILGEEGWELVNVTLDIRPDRPKVPKVVVMGEPTPRENRFYLKRQK